ncbi:MAG: ABC transporter ATP-binding protein [Aureispira sp.]
MSKQTDQVFDQKKALVPFLRRLFKYAWNYPRWVYGLVLWIVAVAIVEALFPLLLKATIDEAITPQLVGLSQLSGEERLAAINWQPVWYYTGLFIGLGVIQFLGVYFFIRYAGRIQEYVIYDLRQAMFKRLQQLSFSFYDRSASGWLLTRLTSDTDRVAEVISWGLIEAFWGLSTIACCLGVLLVYNWKLGLIVACAIPVLLVLSIHIRRLVLNYSRAARRINSDLTATFSEHINGLMVNKSTAQEARVSQEFEQLTTRMQKASFRAAYYTSLYIPLVILIGSIATATVIYWGGHMTIGLEAVITVGTLIAALDYATKIFIPIVEISMFYARAQGALSAGERIFSLIDEPIDIADAPTATAFGKLQGRIQFDQVGFAYSNGQEVLQDFNLTIPAGQSVALVGATGEGKSTIANLVARFYEPTKGRVLIDDEDYQQKTLHSLRSQLGMVLQTPHLFEGSIRENLCYAYPEASAAAVQAALELAGAQQFLERLEEPVGEEGGNLSLGEQQLLSFARAILPNPRILIMDEATSSVDTLTELRLQKGVQKMLEERTAIIIAHRLSTIKNCDRILVIHQGAIVEDGSHEALLQLQGRYYHLYTQQITAERPKMA